MMPQVFGFLDEIVKMPIHIAEGILKFFNLSWEAKRSLLIILFFVFVVCLYVGYMVFV